jgi:deazaflavin-dependent oxidoreductase (nitroreductase family)
MPNSHEGPSKDRTVAPGTRARWSLPRGLVAGTLAALALVWGPYVLIAGSNRISALVQTAVYVGLLVLTIRSRRVKVLVVRTFQRWTINPLMRLLLTIGINPLGLAILETRGRNSGKLRRVPVGNGRKGDSFWIIAEHGMHANYVRNIAHDPRVRVRFRIGWRYRWVTGLATALPDDDALARQRHIIAWHPLRALNAINVRVLGADLVTVHVRLLLDGPADPTQGSTQQESQQLNDDRLAAPAAGFAAR